MKKQYGLKNIDRSCKSKFDKGSSGFGSSLVNPITTVPTGPQKQTKRLHSCLKIFLMYLDEIS